MKNKTARVFELIAALLLGTYSAVMIIYAKTHPASMTGDGMASYTFPVIMYAVMLVCCIILIIQNRITAAKKAKEYKQLTETERKNIGEEKKKEYVFEKLDVRVWITIALILIYVALWQILGFMISTFLFVICEAKVLKKDEPIGKCILVALGAVLIIYLIFVRLFSISLPETFLSNFI